MRKAYATRAAAPDATAEQRVERNAERFPETRPYTLATAERAMNHDPTEAALPPGHVHTLRVATPNPRDAKRHIRVTSGWRHYHVAACGVDLPKNCSETGEAPVGDIECPRCRKTPEFTRAVEDARAARTQPQEERRVEPAPRTPPEATRPQPPARPRSGPGGKKAGNDRPANPQGSLF